jgi:HTH-type transcriptional regulator/antitoxin HigA
MGNVRTTLKSENEYNVALRRTIEIFHAQKGTPESDELDLLLPLIMEYENIHYPIPAPDSHSDSPQCCT